MPASLQMIYAYILALVLCWLPGCGSSYKKPLVPVRGVVNVDGRPATEGYVTFNPILASDADPLTSGKAASGTIKSDGTFELTTYSPGDGAVIGRHYVSFYKPDPVDDEQIVRDPHLPGGAKIEVEVLADGKNVIEFNLHRRGKPDIQRRE